MKKKKFNLQEVFLNHIKADSEAFSSLDNKLTEIKVNSAANGEKLDTLVDNIAQVREQTEKTNGRVSSLETSRNVTYGFLLALSLIILPIFIYVLEHSLIH